MHIVTIIYQYIVTLLIDTIALNETRLNSGLLICGAFLQCDMSWVTHGTFNHTIARLHRAGHQSEAGNTHTVQQSCDIQRRRLARYSRLHPDD